METKPRKKKIKIIAKPVEKEPIVEETNENPELCQVNENVLLYMGDCLEKMKLIPDDSVHLILCDLPYGTTKCKWDTIINLDELWTIYACIN